MLTRQIKNPLSWVAAVLITLGAGVALAVRDNSKAIPEGASASAQAFLSFTELAVPEGKNSNKITAGPLLPRDQATSTTGHAFKTGSDYFQISENYVALGTVNSGNVLLRDPTLKFGGPIASTGFYQYDNNLFNTSGSYSAVYNFIYAPQLKLGVAGDFARYHFGNGAGWNFVKSTPQVKAGDIAWFPSESATRDWRKLWAHYDNPNSNGMVYFSHLMRNYQTVTLNTDYSYQNIRNQYLTSGDGYLASYRTNGGTALNLNGNSFSPRNGNITITHDFVYTPSATGFTDQQIEALRGPSFSNPRIPDNAFTGRWRYVDINGLRYVEDDCPSDREYYYAELLEALGVSDQEIESFLAEIRKWEDAVANFFDGYEKTEWTRVAAQAGPLSTARHDPQPDPKHLPNDGYFHGKGSWGQDYDDQWGLKQIGFTATGRDGKGALWPRKAASTIVAVVDTGIDLGHPELAGVLAANFDEIPNNGKDDDGNGYIDDFLGWNFVDSNNDTRDRNGHGTFVAGIIAARTDNARGIAGINPWARILPVKVSNFDGIGSSVDLALGIVYAARLGARVINLSLTGPLNKAEEVAVKEAVKLGALVVVAAGNEGKNVQDVAPASLPGVITVAATNYKKERERYSNWGTSIDIAAPGSDILSLRAVQTDLMLFADHKYKAGSNIVGSDQRYYRTTGTSFAAPYVAGVASLLFSLNPKLTADQVKRMILQSARDIDVPGIDQYSGYGLLDAAAAVKADPAFFVEARISGVKVVKKDGQTYVQVIGTADADRFDKAWIEIGAGEAPGQWRKLSADITGKVTTGVLQDVEARTFAGQKSWTLRLITAHQNGRTRENRFLLNVN